MQQPKRTGGWQVLQISEVGRFYFQHNFKLNTLRKESNLEISLSSFFKEVEKYTSFNLFYSPLPSIPMTNMEKLYHRLFAFLSILSSVAVACDFKYHIFFMRGGKKDGKEGRKAGSYF